MSLTLITSAATCRGATARESLFKRDTEHLWLRQPIHGIGRDPFARE